MITLRVTFTVGVLAILTTSLSASVTADDSVVDFEEQIAPIFQQHCIRCHFPGNKKGDLSLSTFDDLKSNDFVVSGNPDVSHLIDLVVPQPGQSPVMPKEANPLSDQEVDLLRRWIVEGANWPVGIVVQAKSKADRSWWAYQPLSLTRLSKSMAPSSVTGIRASAIDRFIRDQLAQHGLQRSPRADRRTLIRRLSFDLHGLPPAPEAVEEFVNDPDPSAYENLVDRMLQSPHYGERYARHWLDLAHYADTHGFERDQRRDNAWRYRDYVIRALNEDKPYDRFLQEQIAGDVLWPDDPQATVATGFLAAGPWDFVGQVETKSPKLRRAARSLDLDDMATQVMSATMAMTVNCARCHDHKLDPISQQEYYRLRAVFAGVKREDRTISDAAVQRYDQQKKAIAARLNDIEFEIGRLEGRELDLADIVGGGNGLASGQYRQGIDARTAKVQTRDFGKLGNVVTNKFSPSTSDFINGVFIPDGENGTARIPVSTSGITITGLPTTSGDAWDMIRNGPVASQHSPELGGIDFTTDAHSLLGLHANAGITFDLVAIRTAAGLDDLRFTAKLGYFGAEGESHADAWVFVDGKRVAEYPKLKRTDELQTIDIELAESARFLTLVSTDGGNGFGMDQIGFGDPKLKPVVVAELSKADVQRLAQLRLDRLKVRSNLDALGDPPRYYGVVAEKTVPLVRVLTRGDPESPTGEALTPAGLSALAMLDPDFGTLETDQGTRRAALANWITDPGNPLTPRVIVNRLWQWHFGRGLVDTPSDFGFGGGRPSHPELLDWLATELVRHDWSLKAMHRLIVTSETYKQQSTSRPDDSAMNVDADNRLLWRQDSRRIEAEAIRDSVLFVSGKWNAERGGPGFEDFEYQEAYAPIYTYITADGPALWRRSIYRYIVRTTPDRFLTTLDCPDPANLTPRRMTTTTPLQSLALFNNDFMLRQARYFAQRIKSETGSEALPQIRRAFQLAFGRAPSQQEIEVSVAFVQQQGLFAFCRSLFNSNEFVYVD